MSTLRVLHSEAFATETSINTKEFLVPILMRVYVEASPQQQAILRHQNW